MSNANLHILIAGCGFMGRWHARILRRLGVLNLAVCDPNPGVRLMLQRDLDIQEGYPKLEQALTRNFDAVFICSPPQFHVPQARLALEAGCDVFCEKPLSNSPAGIDQLLELVERTGQIFMIGYPLRFLTGLQRVKHLIDGGAIGRLVSMRATVAVYLPDTRPGVDYRQVYVSRPGGGATLDYLHEIDFVQWVAGAPARHVFAFTGQLSDLEMEADDTAELLVKFKNSVLASIHLSVFQRVRRRRAEFAGTAGTIIIDLTTPEDCFVDIYRAEVGQWQREPYPMERDDIYIAEDKAFLHALSTRKKPVLDGREGQKSLEIALAALASSQQGAVIEL